MTQSLDLWAARWEYYAKLANVLMSTFKDKPTGINDALARLNEFAEFGRADERLAQEIAESQNEDRFGEVFARNRERLAEAMERFKADFQQALPTVEELFGDTIAPQGQNILGDVFANLIDSFKTDTTAALANLADTGLDFAANFVRDAQKFGFDQFQPPEQFAPFRSGFEDAQSTFRRIQSAVVSTDDTPKRQLSALEKLVQSKNDELRRDEDSNRVLHDMLDSLRQGIVAVAG